jgi:hypothetical protein
VRRILFIVAPPVEILAAWLLYSQFGATILFGWLILTRIIDTVCCLVLCATIEQIKSVTPLGWLVSEAAKETQEIGR